MEAVRRAYIYLACLASLQAVAWAVIGLLRDLIAPDRFRSLETTAFELAVVVVGLPIFVAHWLWAQRLAARETEEREAVLRRLYLYGAMATFLGPFLANAFELVGTLMRMALGLAARFSLSGLAPATMLVHNLAAMVVMAVLWAYHRHVAAVDAAVDPEEGGAATVRRLYVYGFSAAGLLLTAVAAANLVGWLLFQIGGRAISAPGGGVAEELARLAVGLPTWLLFWTWAQRAFDRAGAGERASAVRKLYLYLALFASVIATVVTLTMVLAAGLKRLFGAQGAAGRDVREALAILAVAGLVWAYHASVVQKDARLQATGETRAAAWIPQLYRYLVAAIGLGALLVGLGGEASLLIRMAAGADLVQGPAEEAATFTAMILAGLPVWLAPWHRVQMAALAPGAEGDEESRSVVRKVYLYGYLFVATATLLGSGVYVVGRLIGLALGARQGGNLLADVGQALAYSAIAVGVWLYHGWVLRADARRLAAVEARRLASFRLVVVDTGDGGLAHVVQAEVERRLPGLEVQWVALAPDAGGPGEGPAGVELIAAADLIAGPWTMTLPESAGSTELAQAIVASRAPKLLLPAERAGWHGPGAREADARDAVRQVVRAVKQAAAGEVIDVDRGLSAGAIVAIVVGVVVVLLGLAVPLVALLALAGMD
jgi:hypothetical protein